MPSKLAPNTFILRGDGRFDIGRLVDKYDSALLGQQEGRLLDFYVVPPYQNAIEGIITESSSLDISKMYQVGLE